MRVEVDGLNAFAATGGTDPATAAAGGATPVVLVHGAGMDSSVWQLQTRFLAYHGLAVAAVDLPGHGHSEGEPPESIEAMAHWLGRFVQAAGLAPAVLVGHSMGTFISLELAVHRPEMVAGLVLMGTAAAMPVHPELLAAARDDLPRAAALMAGWSHGGPGHLHPNPSPGLWMSGGSRALVERSKPGVLATDLAACAHYEGASKAAEAVSCPVTVVMGRSDKMTPARAATPLLDALTSRGEPTGSATEVITLASSGHMQMTEDAAAIRRIILDAATAIHHSSQSTT